MYWANYLGLGQGEEPERRGLSRAELTAFQQCPGQTPEPGYKLRAAHCPHSDWPSVTAVGHRAPLTHTGLMAGRAVDFQEHVEAGE